MSRSRLRYSLDPVLIVTPRPSGNETWLKREKTEVRNKKSEVSATVSTADGGAVCVCSQ